MSCCLLQKRTVALPRDSSRTTLSDSLLFVGRSDCGSVPAHRRLIEAWLVPCVAHPPPGCTLYHVARISAIWELMVSHPCPERGSICTAGGLGRVSMHAREPTKILSCSFVSGSLARLGTPSVTQPML